MFCGALCDDLELVVEGDRIADVRKACAIGKQKFLHYQRPLLSPAVDGKEVDPGTAIRAAADILRQARYPLIYGLSSTTCEGQVAAVELAAAIGASIDSTSSVCHGPSTMAKQIVGVSTATLGEVKNRADLVIFWGCNPAESHLRHFSRYSVTPRGLLTPGGRKDRRVVVVDVRPTPTARAADMFLQIAPGGDYRALSALRAIVKGERPEGEEVAGVPLERWEELARVCRAARYGMLFFGMGLTMSRGRYMNVVAALSLVRDLNAFTRFAGMAMRGHGNVAGSEQTLAWTTGYPFAVNFSRGTPRYNPGEFTAVDLLARGEADAALVVASDPAAHFPAAAARHLQRIPTIAIEPHPTITTRLASVVIPCAVSGVSAAGTAYRMDGVPLRVKKVIPCPDPSDAEILASIREEVRQC
ncbi:formylmethanofuran dehydrogenase [Clostridiales bacterium PH28_bin88]|nr:formylmethanofuran dehydrogenase [Clostridiales bacterium PH28_bin88]